MVSASRGAPRAFGKLILLAAALAAGDASAATANCSIGEARVGPADTVQVATVEDIAGLVDFGESSPNADQAPSFSVSPDGDELALLIRRADARANRFCEALVFVDHISSRVLRRYAITGAVIRQPYPLREALTANGVIASNRPSWSPDGKTVAFLRDEAGVPQVWLQSRASAAGRYATAAPNGIVAFAWSRDGRSLVYGTREGLSTYRASLAREAQDGYHYDARIVPLRGAAPAPSASLAISYRTQAIGNTGDRPATIDERALVDPMATPGRPAEAIVFAGDAPGRRAWTAPGRAKSWWPKGELHAEIGGTRIACTGSGCRGRIFKLWWVGEDVVFLRREGWGESITAVYRWRPGNAPRRLLATADALIGCDVNASKLICAREASLAPRRLWSFDLANGRMRTLFDPNPRFATLRLPRVTRLHWTGPFGSEGYGDLVVPVTAPPAVGYPLIVVQYHTRGFLRGGIGDEYPVLALAGRGYAVLSVQNAKLYAALVDDPSIHSIIEAERLGMSHDNERRLQLANLEGGLAAAGRLVRLDPTRYGITGVSDAASSAVFALVNSKRFAIAALGSPTFDANFLALAGPAAQAEFEQFGFPAPGSQNDADYYRAIALTPNAARLAVPILFQLPEDEYLMGLPAFAALATARLPVDLYVYPGEPHVKWQPGHRLAVYRRNVAWFDFWLRGVASPNGATGAEVSRWRALRTQFCNRPGQAAADQLCIHASTSTSSVTR